MNSHPDNELFRTIMGIAQAGSTPDTARDQQEAVANAIGCPDWVGYCDSAKSKGRECYCATAARAVVQIERQARSAA